MKYRRSIYLNSGDNEIRNAKNPQYIFIMLSPLYWGDFTNIYLILSDVKLFLDESLQSLTEWLY